MTPRIPRPQLLRRDHPETPPRAVGVEAELASTREELAAARARIEELEQTSGQQVVQDAPGGLVRARLPREQVTALRSAGFNSPAGAARDDARAYASFVTKLFEVRRYSYRLKMLGNPPHPRPQVADKLRTMALGASYGIGVPTVYALWEHPEEIDLSGLPETFVVKANRGAGSMAVLPLRRVPGTTDRFELTDTTARQLTAEEVVRHLTEGERRSGPWYAEQMLVADTPGDQLPPDYKLYCFYGEVGAGFARRVPTHFGSPGWQQQIRFHYFDGEGTTYRWRDERADDSIPLSPLMPELLEAGRVLSKAVPLPFVRVDLYATTAGVVVGELTLGPGGDQYLRAEEDVRLGRMWERAQVRLEMDLASGARPYGIVAGDHPVPELLRPFLP